MKDHNDKVEEDNKTNALGVRTIFNKLSNFSYSLNCIILS